jgi:hypothetical protein
MQSATRAACETRAIEEDAGAIDNPGVRQRGIAEDAIVSGFGAALEEVRIQRGTEGADQSGFIGVDQLGAD